MFRYGFSLTGTLDERNVGALHAVSLHDAIYRGIIHVAQGECGLLPTFRRGISFNKIMKLWRYGSEMYLIHATDVSGSSPCGFP